MTKDPGILKSIIGTDALHLGLWEEGCSTLADAQQALRDRLLQFVPEISSDVLCVENSVGAIAGKLSCSGHEVTALLPAKTALEYAQHTHPGPDYFQGNLLQNLSSLGERSFDVIIFHEHFADYPDLNALFYGFDALLKDEGLLILCDEVLYRKNNASGFDTHQSPEIEEQLARNGFIVLGHERLDEQVSPTFAVVLGALQDKQKNFSALYGDQLEALTSQWQHRSEGFSEEIRGYEYWALRKGQISIRDYEPGDEVSILPLFNAVFNQNRTMAHWQWKYLDNPQGGPFISSAWEGSDLAAHYAAYPVSLTINGNAESTLHVGDTFTMPSKRGVGRGKTSLLGRVVRLFHKLWCEGKIDFFYGFNTGRIQKLGKNILAYEVIAPVYEFSCPCARVARPWWARMVKNLSGYQSEITSRSGGWADSLFEQAKAHYPMLLTRDSQYLKWRYDEHPDHQYQYIVLRKSAKIVGWSVIRQQGNDILFVDALVLPAHAEQLLLNTKETVSQLNNESRLMGWCSQSPDWWKQSLCAQGFAVNRQAQELDLCLTFFSERFSVDEIRDSFYFTMGDSDLF